MTDLIDDLIDALHTVMRPFVRLMADVTRWYDDLPPSIKAEYGDVRYIPMARKKIRRAIRRLNLNR